MELNLNNSTKKGRVKDGPISQTNHNDHVDMAKIVEDSKRALHNEKTKRVRRTKAEIEAARQGTTPTNVQNASGAPLTPLQAPIDRTVPIKNAFKLYSEIFIAKPLSIPEIALDDSEAQACAVAVNDLMNAFPQYFNQNDPKVTAIVGCFITLLPIGYSKYKIYQNHVKLNEKDHVTQINDLHDRLKQNVSTQ